MPDYWQAHFCVNTSGIHSCYEFVMVVAVSCPEDDVLYLFSYIFLFLDVSWYLEKML